jgi:hypothetical protein
MYSKLNSWLVSGLLVCTAMICTSSAYAANKDMLVFGNVSGIIPADLPGNPYGAEIKVEVPEGVVSTTVDGSINPAYFKDRAKGADKVYVGGNLIATVPHENICLSVQGNKAILWHVFTDTVDGFCAAGELGLELFDAENKTVKVINATVAHGITSITECSQADASLLEGGPVFQAEGLIHTVDGV